MKEIEFILYVSSQSKSRDFYKQILQLEPTLDVPGMTEFQLNEYTKLGLMPEAGIAKIISGKTRNPAEGNGIPRCELYINVEDVNESFQRAIKAGAKEVSPVSERNWGDTVGYVSDPDGNIIAFAK